MSRVNGPLVEKLRGEHGWARMELALRSGISRDTIERIESGREPRVERDTVKRLASALSVRERKLLLAH
jgi:transcriptional regulator with XRE-family HTH domain